MADELEPVVDTPAVEAPLSEQPKDETTSPDDPVEAPEVTAEATAEGTEGDDPPPEEEYEDVDWEGEKYSIPKKLKPGLMFQADYTKKTQEVAATKKELEAEKARIIEQSKVAEEDLNIRAEYVAKNKELEGYKNVDWDAWVQQDPIAAQQGFIRQQQLQNEIGGLNQKIQEQARQRSSEAQQETAKRLNDTHEFAKTIPGWTPETDKQVVEFAEAQGFSREELQAAFSPRIYQILHFAMKGHEVLTKPVAKPPPLKPTPLKVVQARGNQPVSKSLEDMSTEEYVAFRQKQMAAEAKR